MSTIFHPSVDYIWDNDEWLDIWEEWKLYRKQLGIKNWDYVPIGEKRTLSEIHKWAKGDVNNAIELVKHAISKGWRGVHLPDGWYNKPRNGVMRFPNDWNIEFSKKLTGPQLSEYYHHLRENCELKPVHHKGNLVKWVPKNQVV